MDVVVVVVIFFATRESRRKHARINAVKHWKRTRPFGQQYLFPLYCKNTLQKYPAKIILSCFDLRNILLSNQTITLLYVHYNHIIFHIKFIIVVYYRRANKASCCCSLLVTLCSVNSLNTQRHRLTIYENRPIIERKLKDIILFCKEDPKRYQTKTSIIASPLFLRQSTADSTGQGYSASN